MSAGPLRIYHNPGCSKSRSACQIAAEAGWEVEVVNYLTTPLGPAERILELR